MKKTLFLTIILFIFSLSAQEKKEKLKDQEVDASCGLCQFGTKDKDCILTIRYQNKVYTVVGSHIDDHGDAHASNGFCNTIRKAKVSGTLHQGKFLAKKFNLTQIIR
ncbi:MULTISPECIES: DUF6370 family protein [Flavobacterium]|uniref:DUF6370 family protein n=1 Tax=Flavobacterium covae TaxID=2906076 RepID=A0ABW8PGB2_9FLAO|nr:MULTISPECIES: DUF6370 family protein [Flavobacterium]AMA50595.1 hypothetical protein AWN65_01885 [Flavobacterium covae]AND65502.1 hypothetical protein AX766_03470 [Flavobacterium covae]MCJ1806650.1 DUF6370 family protein [Flavobacterium covae]MCJ1810489.1 DUF6370 family protein [Flavobacterium covae]OWP82261.1 hypothetical protein BWK63_02050 [Flavobacterium covae]